MEAFEAIRTLLAVRSYRDTPEKTTATRSPELAAGAPSGVSRPARPAVPVADTSKPAAWPSRWASTRGGCRLSGR